MNKQLREAARQELARRNYASYVTYTHNGMYQHARHTKLICDRLERLTTERDQRIVIAIPPRHSKSMTITETYPSYYLGKNPNKRVVLAAYSATLAKTFSRRNRAKLEEFGKTLFDVNLSKTKASAEEWELDNNMGGQIAVGMLGGATGFGADLLVIDDPIKNSKEALSETIRQNIWDEWEGTFSTRLHPGANVIVIMTMWHQDDLASRLIRKGWESLIIPCEALENDILGRKPGQPLWPKRGYDNAWMEAKKKEVGSRVWSALYQQNPVPSDGDVFKENWFKFYKRSELPELPRELQSWDAAFKGDDRSDYVVGQTWGAFGADAYLTHQVRDKLTFTKTIESMRNMSKAYPNTSEKLVEDKANGPAILDSLSKEIPGLIPINPQGSKMSRALAITPFFESGNVWFPHPDEAPWVDALVSELLAFPNGQHDDQVDALSQALTRIFLGKETKVKTRRGLY